MNIINIIIILLSIITYINCGIIPGEFTATNTPSQTSLDVELIDTWSDSGETFTKYNVYIKESISGVFLLLDEADWSHTYPGDGGVEPTPETMTISNLYPALSYSFILESVWVSATENSTESNVFTTLEDVPDKAHTVVVTTVNDTALSVAYETGAYSGTTDPVTNYRHDIIVSNTPLVYSQTITVDNTSPVIVGGLSPNVVYDVVVRAKNENGDNDALPISGTTYGPPEEVGSVSLNALSATSIEINFVAGDLNAELSDKGDYVVYAKETGGSFFLATIQGSASNSPIVINSLTYNTVYTIKVEANNVYGSTNSSSDTELTHGIAPPKADYITIDQKTNESFRVSFTESDNSNGGTLLGHDIYVTLSGQSAVNWSTSLTSPVDITGLNPLGVYTVFIRARSTYGTNDSDTTAPETMFGPPPQSVVQGSISHSDVSATLVWTASNTDNGGPLLPYRIYVQENGGSFVFRKEVSGTTTTVVLNTLTNYRFRAYATTQWGSVASSNSELITTYGPPPPPSDLALQGGSKTNNFLRLTFTASDISNGGTLGDYDVHASLDGGSYSSIATTSSSPVEISSLQPGATYRFKIYATSTYGTSEESAETPDITMYDVPDQIVITDVVNLVNQLSDLDKMVISIDSPVSNNEGNTWDLRVYVKPLNGVFTEASILDNSYTPLTVQGLTANTSYTFKVGAYNEYGNGENSTETTPLISNSKSGKVLLVTVTATNFDEIQVTWDAANQSPADTQYLVEWKKDGDASFTALPLTASRLVNIDGLTKDTRYVVRVRAQNFFGFTEFSDEFSGLTLGASPPGIPSISIKEFDAHSITVEWSRVAEEGEPVIQWEISVDNVVDNTISSGVDQSVLEATVNNLQANTVYDITVKALSENLTSSASNVAKQRTSQIAPNAITIINVDSTTNNSISLSWTEPFDNNLAVTNYEVHTTCCGIHGTTGSTTYTVQPLQSGTEYTFTVYSNNPQGRSLGKGIVATTVRPGQPASVPQNLRTTSIGDTTINLAWDQPADWGEGARRSYIIDVDGEKHSDTTLLAQELSNLEIGQNYDIKVFALNEYGISTAAVISVITRGQPTLPQDVVVVDTTYFGCSLKWGVPSDNGGEPITGYNIKVLQNLNQVLEYKVSDTSYAITQLSDGVEYSIRVAAFNKFGNGPHVAVRVETQQLSNITNVLAGGKVWGQKLTMHIKDKVETKDLRGLLKEIIQNNTLAPSQIIIDSIDGTVLTLIIVRDSDTVDDIRGWIGNNNTRFCSVVNCTRGYSQLPGSAFTQCSDNVYFETCDDKTTDSGSLLVIFLTLVGFILIVGGILIGQSWHQKKYPNAIDLKEKMEEEDEEESEV